MAKVVLAMTDKTLEEAMERISEGDVASWTLFSQFKDLRWEFVQTHLNKPWDWTCLTRNENVATWGTVKNNPDLPWDWTWLTDLLFSDCDDD